jgi:hypothetical protein
VDGGLWANNPSLTAILEAHLRRGISFDEMRLISVGNGEVPSGLVGVDFDRTRRMKMLNPILDMMFSTQSELAEQAASILLNDLDMAHRMLRVNAVLPQGIDLDDVNGALQKLPALAEFEARNYGYKFKTIAEPSGEPPVQVTKPPVHC